MTNAPTIPSDRPERLEVSGRELAAHLAAIRAKGGHVVRLETVPRHNATWRLTIHWPDAAQGELFAAPSKMPYNAPTPFTYDNHCQTIPDACKVPFRSNAGHRGKESFFRGAGLAGQRTFRGSCA